VGILYILKITEIVLINVILALFTQLRPWTIPYSYTITSVVVVIVIVIRVVMLVAVRIIMVRMIVVDSDIV